MRIVVNDYLGQASQVQLSRALASRGHEILHLYCSDVQSPKGDLIKSAHDSATFFVEGLSLPSSSHRTFLSARFHEYRFGRHVAKRAMLFKPDAVLACNNPLDVQRSIVRACRRASIPFVYWLQEFYSVTIDRMIDSWSPLINSLVGSYYHWLEQRLLQSSDAIVPIGHDLLGMLATYWDVYERQCMVVPNWSPIDRLQPGAKNNPWSNSQGLADKKIALYTGSLGPREDPLLLAHLAEQLRERSDVQIIVVSEGDGADRLTLECKRRTLSNLRVIPFQPYANYSNVLASADVLLAFVNEQAGSLFVPSKINSYLCANRAIVLSAPKHNLAATVINQSRGGRVVAPGDIASLCDAVLQYLDQERLRQEAGRLGREYAEGNFGIESIASRFERLFERLARGTPRRRHGNRESYNYQGLS